MSYEANVCMSYDLCQFMYKVRLSLRTSLIIDRYDVWIGCDVPKSSGCAILFTI